MTLAARAFAALRGAARWVIGEAPGAIRGHVNVSELARRVAAALLAGGGGLGVYQAVVKDLAHIVGPADLATASALLTLGLAALAPAPHRKSRDPGRRRHAREISATR